IAINEEEIQNIAGNFYDRPDGAAYSDKEHPYVNDLDIFGRASLFQYVNRTTSEPAEVLLANDLMHAAPFENIIDRQGAIKELSSDINWLQDMHANGRKSPIKLATVARLEHWLKQPPTFSKFKAWSWLRYLLPLIIILIVVGFIFDFVSITALLLGLLFFAILAYQINKYVAPLHEQLSNVAGEFETLERNIIKIESREFKSKLLSALSDSVRKNSRGAGSSINTLKKILDRLDLRYNLVLSAPLNLLLLWNLQQALDLEKWKFENEDSIGGWINTLAQFEALGSFSVLHFNHPEWSFPTITRDYFSIEGEEIGHPLIKENKRINNDISIPDDEHIMLITGSNMAGKSTYLRSIGVNIVLAFAGSPVCAKNFSVSYVKLMSSMRITDNLEESTSTFYAELKKLKTIIESVNAGENVFILLDEILRGTNSLDRHTGSKALIRQLMDKKAAAIIATHDLELATDPGAYSTHLLNYHFDVQVNDEQLFFDYKLKTGICNSLNASLLMKQIGIEI
ncbi:MAG: MutS family DNA mismatch repair protein, partial [Ginsengibacter sp.]